MPAITNRNPSATGENRLLHPLRDAGSDRRSLALLILLVIYLVIHPFLDSSLLGQVILAGSLFAILISATIEFSARSEWRLPAIVLASLSIISMLLSIALHSRIMDIVSWSLTACFFALVSSGLFAYLGRPGQVTSGRIYASVSLYLLIGVFWFCIYNFVEASHSGSFGQSAANTTGPLSRASLLYFSMCTLTTVGYGDMVPITPVARMLASLEAASGVLYIAITVSRLVSGYGNKEA